VEEHPGAAFVPAARDFLRRTADAVHAARRRCAERTHRIPPHDDSRFRALDALRGLQRAGVSEAVRAAPVRLSALRASPAAHGGPTPAAAARPRQLLRARPRYLLA